MKLLTLLFILINSSYGSEYRELRKKICSKKILRECDQKVENFLFSKIPQIALRKNDKLIIKINNGQSKQFNKNRYLIYLFKADSLIVISNAETEYTDNDYSLLNYRTGIEYKIHGVPVFSPNKEKFVTYNTFNPIMSGPRYIEIWSKLSTGVFQKEWKSSLGDDGMDNVIWKNDSEIRGDRVKEIAPTRGVRFTLKKEKKWRIKLGNKYTD